jgi:protein SCO1/2
MVARIAAPALLVAAQAAALGPPQDARPDPGLPPALQGVGIEQRLGASVPLDLALRDEQGRPVALSELLRGRPVILALAYYRCPMLCQQVLGGVATSLRGLGLEAGRDYDVLTVSFDPRDTAERAAAAKRAYAARAGRPGVEAAWHFLTAAAPEIERLTEAVGFGYRYDAQRDEFAHASGIMVLTPEGRLSRYLFGLEYPPRDVRLALVEAARGRIGTPVDRLLLYCYRYDPAAGHYSLAVLKLVRLASLATLGALAVLILVLRRRGAAPVAGRP